MEKLNIMNCKCQKFKTTTLPTTTNTKCYNQEINNKIIENHGEQKEIKNKIESQQTNLKEIILA